jgi:hypothetical protein
MKCEVCINQLEEYVDGELVQRDAEQVRAHLTTCAGCSRAFEGLSAEQEIYARYDRELEISPSTWNAIEARTTAESRAFDSSRHNRLRNWFALPSFGWSFAGAMAALMAALMIGVVYLRAHRQTVKQEVTARENKVNSAGSNERKQISGGEKVLATDAGPNKPLDQKNRHLVRASVKATQTANFAASKKPETASRSDVLSSDVASSAAEEEDTQRHIEQAENLLRSVRNIQVSEDESEVDVSYEKALSRRLLNENVVLRRDAEMSGKFPTKTLLTDLEPFLIDIANLPDKASPDELRVIKERVQKAEIVADLRSY